MGNSGKLFKIQETYGNATASLLGLYKNFTGTVTGTRRKAYADRLGTLRGPLRNSWGDLKDRGNSRRGVCKDPAEILRGTLRAFYYKRT